MVKYIWSSPAWPRFRWEESVVEARCKLYSKQKSELDAVFESLTEDMQKTAIAEAIAHDAVDSSVLEGVAVSYDAVYSAISRMLGLDVPKSSHVNGNAQALAEILKDASSIKLLDFSQDRMLFWHRRLFEGLAGNAKPKLVGEFRKEPVYVVRYSGDMEGEILYEGVPVDRIPEEVDAFIAFLKDESIPAVVRSAVAAVWFPLIHPFQDGNGRLSRIIADMVLFEDEEYRCISVSSAIRKNKKEYYAHLEKVDTQDDMDMTEWICWYIDIVIEAVKDAVENCSKKLELSAFMSKLREGDYNKREIDMLYRLASGSFYGKLTADKWKKMTKCTPATATRDLSHLVDRGLLIREGDGGRGTYYRLNPDATNI